MSSNMAVDPVGTNDQIALVSASVCGVRQHTAILLVDSYDVFAHVDVRSLGE